MPLQNVSKTADIPTATTESPSCGLTLSPQTGFEEAAGWRARIESVIERYPWPTVLSALALGYAISRRIR